MLGCINGGGRSQRQLMVPGTSTLVKPGACGAPAPRASGLDERRRPRVRLPWSNDALCHAQGN